MTAARDARASVLFGLGAAFLAGVNLLRAVRPALLSDPDASWAPMRLGLALTVVAGAAAAGVLGAWLFGLWAATAWAAEPLRPLPFSRRTLAALTLAAVLAGAALRLADLDRRLEALWVDDLSLIAPALALSGTPPDFADAIRPTPAGVPRPYGTIGVLYLEGYRGVLRLAGTTVLGVRLPSAIGGILALVTGTLLGRALLPAGGGMLTALVLAGLRGALILSRWAFNMILLAPIVDLATLALLAGRRRRSAGLCAAAGAIAGTGAHVYLSAWPAGAGLALFALWPSDPGDRRRARVARAAAFAAAFAAVAAPLFLLREGRTTPYFARTADHNVALEMRRERSPLPPVYAAADALGAPWWLADPSARHDLPGRTRLGWILGVPAAMAVARALARPRRELSGLLLAQGAAFVAAVVAGGQADNPNGSRFAYLASLAAVAAAAGVLWALGRVPLPRRRAAGIAAVGILAIAGAVGARDALGVWPDRFETFDAFHGQDTLIGRAAARWSALGEVEIAGGVGHSPVAVDAVRRYRLDPDLWTFAAAPDPHRRIRVAPPGTAPGASERVVERVTDGRGRERAVVTAERRAP